MTIVVLSAMVDACSVPVEVDSTQQALSGVICGNDCSSATGAVNEVPIARFKSQGCSSDRVTPANATSCQDIAELGDLYTQCNTFLIPSGCIDGYHVIKIGQTNTCNNGGEIGFPQSTNVFSCERDDDDFTACGDDAFCPEGLTKVATLILPNCDPPGFVRTSTNVETNARRCVRQ